MRILAVGDSYMPVRYFRDAFAGLETAHEVVYMEVDVTSRFEPSTASELKLTEYLGSPRTLADWMSGVEVLVVQGAPVTAEVVQAGSELRLIGCARGGPVNIDTEAVEAHGLPLVNTPGKNATAVADLTIAFLVMLARRIPSAMRFLVEGHQLKDVWDGTQFMGIDLAGHTLGLVGYGKVGQQVAQRALAFGMEVVVYDPYVQTEDANQVDTLPELLSRSDFVSLHARATATNAHLIDAAAIAAMRRGAFLINTARPSLIDEAALDAALAREQLAGAALDVCEPTSPGVPSQLSRHANVVITPHIGGATRETLQRGADMLAEEIRRFAASEPLINLVGKISAGA